MMYGMLAAIAILIAIIMYVLYTKTTYLTPYVTMAKSYLPESLGGTPKVPKIQ